MATLDVEIWSDIACPWCYVGKRRLDAALAAFPGRSEVEVVWRAYELDPAAPRERAPGEPYVERLARKYGTTVAQAEAMIRRMVAVAKQDGLDLRFDRVRAGNTFDAHRLMHFASSEKRQDAMMERLFRGYFTEGEPIGDPAVLARLAGEVGLDVDAAAGALASDTYSRAVRAEEERARELGVRGVPFFVIGGRYAVSGAQPAETLGQALQQAWDERISAMAAANAEAPVCGPEGCI